MGCRLAQRHAEIKHMFEGVAECRALVLEIAHPFDSNACTNPIGELVERIKMSTLAPFPALRPMVESAHPNHASRRVGTQAVGAPRLRLVTDDSSRRPTKGGPRASVRLTRRGHVALFAASCLALLGIVVGSGAVADAAVGISPEPATALVLVEQGDSLWSIASVLDPDQDPRAMVQRIRELNGIGDWPIVPGQRLLVPASPVAP